MDQQRIANLFCRTPQITFASFFCRNILMRDAHFVMLNGSPGFYFACKAVCSHLRLRECRQVCSRANAKRQSLSSFGYHAHGKVNLIERWSFPYILTDSIIAIRSLISIPLTIHIQSRTPNPQLPFKIPQPHIIPQLLNRRSTSLFGAATSIWLILQISIFPFGKRTMILYNLPHVCSSIMNC